MACPHCGLRIRFAQRHVGSKAKCPTCHRSFVLRLEPSPDSPFEPTVRQDANPFGVGSSPRPMTQAYHGQKRSRVAAFLFAWFFGLLGIHRFYLGHVGLGLAYLLSTVFFWWTIFVPVIVAVICFVEGIVFLASSDPMFD